MLLGGSGRGGGRPCGATRVLAAAAASPGSDGAAVALARQPALRRAGVLPCPGALLGPHAARRRGRPILLGLYGLLERPAPFRAVPGAAAAAEEPRDPGARRGEGAGRGGEGLPRGAGVPEGQEAVLHGEIVGGLRLQQGLPCPRQPCRLEALCAALRRREREPHDSLVAPPAPVGREASRAGLRPVPQLRHRGEARLQQDDLRALLLGPRQERAAYLCLRRTAHSWPVLAGAPGRPALLPVYLGRAAGLDVRLHVGLPQLHPAPLQQV
mmetsp:Transcript_3067/g.10206  ORF Transcript_3067/g.10206 Transcript_3067/m.10206 type:complete len:269 (+) Transcript_3067:118-924(+)